MSLINCRVCKGSVADSAKHCPHCGVKHPYNINFWATKLSAVLITLFLIYVVFSGGLKRFINNNIIACEIIEIDVVSEVFLINNEFDAGYLIKARIRNDGFTDSVRVNYNISSSEGIIEKSNKYKLSKGQEALFEMQFTEPTINAKEVVGEVSCSSL